jgi:hypothetical protein
VNVNQLQKWVTLSRELRICRAVGLTWPATVPRPQQPHVHQRSQHYSTCRWQIRHGHSQIAGQKTHAQLQTVKGGVLSLCEMATQELTRRHLTLRTLLHTCTQPPTSSKRQGGRSPWTSSLGAHAVIHMQQLAMMAAETRAPPLVDGVGEPPFQACDATTHSPTTAAVALAPMHRTAKSLLRVRGWAVGSGSACATQKYGVRFAQWDTDVTVAAETRLRSQGCASQRSASFAWVHNLA